MTTTLLTRKQFASALGLSVATIDRGRKNNIFPFSSYIRLKNSIRYTVKTLNEVLSGSVNQNEEKNDLNIR